MRRKNSGVMVSFTLGLVTGLCSTSEGARKWVYERAHRAIKPRDERCIIDVEVEELS